jgi:site-specific DNA-cytosine methylase
MGDSRPLVFDMFAGLGGWSEAFIAEGYTAIGFDIEAHNYGNGGYPGKLIVKDIRSINGAVLVAAYGVPACIVASPPCQEFSYMAMPWSKAKDKMRKILASEAEQKRLCELFNECFRIQREVSAAAGHYVPMVVENVRGAQRWVGKARWNFGSFYLWGDVPALMPIPGKVRKTPEGSWDLTRANYNGDHAWKDEGVKAGDRNKGAKDGEHKWSTDWSNKERGEGSKTVGMNWSDQTKRGQDFTRIAGQQAGLKLAGNNSARRWEDRPVQRLCDAGGKAMNIAMTCAELKEATGGKGYATRLGESQVSRMYSSKSKQRKQASAEIAKIPHPLAQWIARCFKPQTTPQL